MEQELNMSIATEITALNNNLSAAKDAVTAAGGTVGDTGLAGLATEIASIPTGGGGDWGTVTYLDANDQPQTATIQNLTEYMTLASTTSNSTWSATINGQTIGVAKITGVSLGELATFLPDYFLSYCPNNFTFSAPYLTKIGNNVFRYSGFNRNIELSSDIKSIGTGFMYNCNDMVSTITANCDPPILSNQNLSTTTISAPMNQTGVTIAGTKESEWKASLTNRSSSPYRKIVDGIWQNYLKTSSETVYFDDSEVSKLYNTSQESSPTSKTINGVVISSPGTQVREVDLSGSALTNMTTRGFLAGFSNVNKVALPPNLTSVGDYFLYKTGGLTTIVNGFPNLKTTGRSFLAYGSSTLFGNFTFSELTTAGDYFMSGRDATGALSFPKLVTLGSEAFSASAYAGFRGTLVFANTLTTIGTNFLSQGVTDASQAKYNHDLTLPNSITSIGDGFMRCAKMTSTIYLGDLQPDIVSGWSSLSVQTNTAPSYTTGMKISGTYAADWHTTFPDSATSTCYRKLIVV